MNFAIFFYSNLFCFLLFTGCFLPTAHAQELEELYWLNSRGIYKTSLQTVAPEEIVRVEIAFPDDIAYDPGANKIYWSNPGLQKIRRANPDGSEREDVITDITSFANDIALDLINNKLYWTDKPGHVIRRSNLDGSEVETVVATDTTVTPGSLVVDPERDVFYWVGVFDQGEEPREYRVLRTTLDGSGAEPVVSGQSSIGKLALDRVNDKLYWSSLAEDAIFRSNIDGSTIEKIIDPQDDQISPYDVAVNPDQNILFWSDQFGDSIYRANLDGSNNQFIVEPDEIGSMTLDPVNGRIYFTDLFSSRVLGVDVDGTNQQVLVESAVVIPEVMVLDHVNEQIYYKERWFNQLQRVGFDGSNITETSFRATRLDGYALTVDNKRGKVYWSLYSPSALRRANLDGTMSELIRMPDNLRPVSMALDINLERMYWIAFDTDDRNYSFYAGDPGLEDVDTLIRPGVIERPRGIAIHTGVGKMYWVNVSTNTIQRANLDGTAIEDIVTGDIGFPAHVVVDPTGNKIYWPNYDGNKIQRANLDGSEVEDVIDAFRPKNIALRLPLSVATRIEDESTALPESPAVSGAYPNPFIGSTQINYVLNEGRFVRITVFDMLGREIVELMHEAEQPGDHVVLWDGKDSQGVEVPAGVYLVQLVGEQTKNEAVIVVKTR